jgi:hypothetical protein
VVGLELGQKFLRIHPDHRKGFFQAANSLAVHASPVLCGAFLEPLVELFGNVLDCQRCHNKSFEIQNGTILEAYPATLEAFKDDAGLRRSRLGGIAAIRINRGWAHPLYKNSK